MRRKKRKVEPDVYILDDQESEWQFAEMLWREEQAEKEMEDGVD